MAFVDQLSPVSLLLLTFLVGSGAALHIPAYQASVADLVPRSQVPQAILLNGVSYNLTRSAGPALGGALVATVGAAVAFAVNAVSHIALIVVLLRETSFSTLDTLPREPIGGAIRAGLRYVMKAPTIRTVLIRGMVFGIGSAALQALLPLVAKTMLGGGPKLYGVLFGFFGLGGVFGAFGSVRLRKRVGHEWTVRRGFLGQAVASAIVAAGSPLWLVAIAMFVSGTTWVMALSLFNATIQLAMPRWVAARTLALYQTLTFGGMALGSWIRGTLAEIDGLQLAFAGSSAMRLAGMVVGFLRPMPESTPDNLAPVERWTEPETAVELGKDSGPIMVAIDYAIAEEDLADFLALMRERSLIRQRNGASGWTLSRDTQRAEQWTEMYYLPTWLGYIRHNKRTTQADAENTDKIRALHRGSQAPVVTRRLVRSRL